VLFYFTGVFYDIATKIKNPVYRTILLDLNPLANLIHNAREVLLYESSPIGLWLMIWFFLSLGISYLGVKTIYKYENTYVKVMR